MVGKVVNKYGLDRYVRNMF